MRSWTEELILGIVVDSSLKSTPRRSATTSFEAPLPKRYASLVVTAAVVMSLPDITPALLISTPIEYEESETPPLRHCDTATQIIFFFGDFQGSIETIL